METPITSNVVREGKIITRFGVNSEPRNHLPDGQMIISPRGIDPTGSKSPGETGKIIVRGLPYLLRLFHGDCVCLTSNVPHPTKPFIFLQMANVVCKHIVTTGGIRSMRISVYIAEEGVSRSWS